ncbi:MAG: hypothetical protein ACI9MR_003483 [Myxococcota bacterium]|jgi:hypothetical protein
MRNPSIALGLAVLLLGSWSGCGDASDPSVADDTADVADTADPQDTVDATDTGVLDTGVLDTVDPETAETETADTETADTETADDTTPVSDTVPPEPTCSDGAINGDETGEDCGGPTCPKCAVNMACDGDEDCMSASCDTGLCSVFVLQTIADIQLHATSTGCTVQADQPTQAMIRTVGVATSPVFAASPSYDGVYLGAPTSGPNSGLLVVWPNTLTIPDIAPGVRVAAYGQVKEFFCMTELVASEIRGVDTQPVPSPVTVAVGAVAAEQYEGTLVRIEHVAITETATGYYKLDGGLQIDTAHFMPTVTLSIPRFGAIEGVLAYTFGEYRVDALRLEAAIDPCASSPCDNGGSCNVDGDGFTCQCPARYEGDLCQTDLGNCADDATGAVACRTSLAADCAGMIYDPTGLFEAAIVQLDCANGLAENHCVASGTEGCANPEGCVRDLSVGLDLGAPREVTQVRFRADGQGNHPKDYDLFVSNDLGETFQYVASGQTQPGAWRCVTGESCGTPDVPDACCPDGATQPQDTRDVGDMYAKYHYLDVPATTGQLWALQVVSTQVPGRLVLKEIEMRGCSADFRGGSCQTAQTLPGGAGSELSGSTAVAPSASAAAGACMTTGDNGAAAPDQLWSLTAFSAGTYRVRVSPTAALFDPIVYAVAEADCLGQTSCEGVDTYNPGIAEVLELTLADDETAVVVVDGYNGSSGDYTIEALKRGDTCDWPLLAEIVGGDTAPGGYAARLRGDARDPAIGAERYVACGNAGENPVDFYYLFTPLKAGRYRVAGTDFGRTAFEVRAESGAQPQVSGCFGLNETQINSCDITSPAGVVLAEGQTIMVGVSTRRWGAFNLWIRYVSSF